MKLRVNPIEKHVNSIFNGKSVVIFRAVLKFFWPPASRAGKVEKLPAPPPQKWKGNFRCSGAYDSIFVQVHYVLASTVEVLKN